MRDDSIRQHLGERNPWWKAQVLGEEATAWTERHPVLQGLARYDIGYRTEVLDDVATDPLGDRVIVLSGPRRIGKSVAMLQLAAALCERGDVDPRQIIHVPCDTLTLQDVRRVLTLARSMTESVDLDGARPRVWLFDEITSVRGWSSVFKDARDNTAFAHDTVIATGSRWDPDEDVEGNLMAGRAGSETRRRRVLLPMSFREFIGTTRENLPALPRVHPGHLQSDETRAQLAETGLFVDEFDLAWQQFLSVGGFPRAVAEYVRNGAVSDAYLQDLQAWLHRDMDPESTPESVPLLLEALSERATSPLAVNPTAIIIGRTRAALETRLTRMVSSHAVLRCPQRDDSGALVPRTQSKHYLTDPVLSWLPSRLRAGSKAPAMTSLTEQTIGVHLARAVDAHSEGRWLAGDTIGYVRTSNDREIDLSSISLPSDAGTVMTVPIESKWVSRGWKSEARVIVGKYQRGILATKSILDTSGEVWAVPAPLLAMALL
ncbi:AAA family ATPase [Isoptericola rhizosphaerae]|uniref:AAA family ATPase n=1 Tax=Isoptericola rhizosphaerae TaxID=3377837 RepID=UPI00383ABC2F